MPSPLRSAEEWTRLANSESASWRNFKSVRIPRTQKPPRDWRSGQPTSDPNLQRPREQRRVRIMTGKQVVSPRESFTEAAQREMIAFELKERELRKQEKQERAEQLYLPVLKKELQGHERLSLL